MLNLMMKNTFLALIAFVSSSAFATDWPSTIVSDYSAKKNFEQLLCADAKTASEKETCQFYKITLGKKLQNSLPKLHLENASTLVLNTSKSILRITRGDSPTVFVVNAYKLDMQDSSSLKEFRQRLSNQLPKQTSSTSFWMSAAYADSGADPEALAAIESLVNSAVQTDSCRSMRNFINACNDKAYFLDKTIISASSAWTGQSSSVKAQEVKKISAYVQQLDRLNHIVDNVSLPYMVTQYPSCPLTSKMDATEFEVCRQNLLAYEEALQVIGQRMMSAQKFTKTLDKADPFAKIPAKGVGKPVPAADPGLQ